MVLPEFTPLTTPVIAQQVQTPMVTIPQAILTQWLSNNPITLSTNMAELMTLFQAIVLYNKLIVTSITTINCNPTASKTPQQPISSATARSSTPSSTVPQARTSPQQPSVLQYKRIKLKEKRETKPEWVVCF